ncbi:MAG TPA: molybdopterin-synthase adenylyltransferase MoeB [Limnochordia bacterium]|nr:molybdopterin-synthase adenylyltransferase MoeB [Limnochordia bacterium]
MATRTRQLTDEQLDRYSRQVILQELGAEGQKRLLESSVLIVGGGALGSPTAVYLAAAGVGTVGIIDADVVEVSNLHRQIMHSMETIDQPKAESAKQFINRLNPDVNVVVHQTYLDSSNALEIIKQYDVVVNGCDNFPTRYLVNDACVFLNKPMVDASILRWEGQATVFLPGKGCYRCLYPAPPPPGEVPNCAQAGIVGALAGHMGTLQAIETIKLLLGTGESLAGKLVIYDAMTGERRQVKLRRDPNCPVCGEHPTITELIDYEEFCGLPPRRDEEGGAPAKSPATVVAENGWEMDPEELFERRQNGGAPFVLDVRDPEEYVAFHIDGAALIPVDDLAERMGELASHKGEEIAVVCLSGGRSARATVALREAGYQATNVRKGMMAWLNAQLPTKQGPPPAQKAG